jgi:hypothetical protein
MKKIVIFLFLTVSSLNLFSQDSIRIFGQVRDFKGNPLDSVTVRLKNKKFENLYETITDRNGYYEIKALKNSYNCLYAIKFSEYAKTKLEYWAWNIPAYSNLEINPKYDRMEVYGINAFEPQVSPHDTYIIYFRPMSLTKSLKIQGKINKKELEQNAISEKSLVNIAPDTISKNELDVRINGYQSDVLAINKITEYARGVLMYGYTIQIRKPLESEKLELEYDKISIILHSQETNEFGMGECFVKRLK